jgi:hypothetical protein
VLAAFQVDDSWLESKGDIDDPRRHAPQTTHSLLLIDHDDVTETFRFLNSWGPTWGDEGFGNLPYRYWSDRLLEAWIPDNRTITSPQTTESSGFAVSVNHAADWWGRQIHLVDIEDLGTKELVGWTILIQTSQELELEELFVRPAFREDGHGRILASIISEARIQIRLPLKAWVPHADWPASPAQEAVLGHLGLSLGETPERWAAAVAVEG